DSRAGALFGLAETPTPTVEEMPAETVTLPGGASWKVPHTPGHSPGHRILVGDGYALVGDLVFQGSIGRLDLPGGDAEAMRKSLALLSALPPAYDLFPGHGPPTTLERELAHNPYLQEGSRWI
ncbi:MBL fold metallo-hydrolase, partial [bacterium]|nr:MBL fold metallo-hydrolase [bacterium]